MVLGVFIIRFKNRTARQIYVGAVVIVNMILSLVAIFVAPKGQTVTLIPFTENYSIALRLDGMAVFFRLHSVYPLGGRNFLFL